jgi:toxin secretion/phage lysis holin
MDTKVEVVKVAIGCFVTSLLKCLGANYKIVLLLICFMVTDTILGWLGNIKKGTWKSKNARWGVVGKLVELIIIALMYLCEWAFAIDWLISAITLYFLLCEGASIIENIVKYHLNDNIPEGLVEVLSKAKNNFVGVVIKKIKSIFEEDKEDE